LWLAEVPVVARCFLGSLPHNFHDNFRYSKVKSLGANALVSVFNLRRIANHVTSVVGSIKRDELPSVEHEKSWLNVVSICLRVESKSMAIVTHCNIIARFFASGK